jgi:hypothetical protein
MDWDLYLTDKVNAEYIVGTNIINYSTFLKEHEVFKEKFKKVLTTKEANRIFKLMLMGKYRTIPC